MLSEGQIIELEIEKSIIIDWYDGMMEGLYWLRGEAKPYYCSLLAWDIKRDIYVFASVRISVPITGLIDALEYQGHATALSWAHIRNEIEALKKEQTGTVQIYRVVGKGFPTEKSTSKSVEDLGFDKLKRVLPQMGNGVEFALEQTQINVWI